MQISAGRIFFALGILAALEIAYRAQLYIRFPESFSNVNRVMMVSDKPQWEYDSRFGYTYPHVNITTTSIKKGSVIACTRHTYANIQGNIGPAVLDFDQAEYRIAIFGDSFSAFALDGVTWPNLLAAELGRSRGQKVRVMNLARDGYGVMQMFDLAAVKIPELKPTLVVFAFNTTAIARDRTWRAKVGEGDDARMLSTMENSPNPSLEHSVDMQTLMPAAGSEWCDSMLNKSADEQIKDRVLQTATKKALRVIDDNKTLLKANVWDLRSSYIYDRLVHRDIYFGQRRQVPPAANPIIKFDDFGKDAAFLKAVAAAREQGVPFLLVHLPMGISIRDHEEFYIDEHGRTLMKSLEEVTEKKVLGLRAYLSIRDDDGMKLCYQPDDCHPSRFGMQMYAEAVAKLLDPLLRRESH